MPAVATGRSNRYWSGLYSRFNELAHPREFAEEKMLSIAQQNICFDSHITYLTKVCSIYCPPLGSITKLVLW